MSETESLMAIWREIDQKTVANGALVPIVAQVLCPYRDGAAGWFAPFQTWVLANGGGTFPTLEDALHEMAEPPEPPKPRALARRLLAFSALSRVQVPTKLAESSLGGLATRALVAPGLADNEGDAAKLLQALSDPAVLPDLSYWGSMLTKLRASSLISAEVAAQVVPPCSGKLETITGNNRPVAVLTADFSFAVTPQIGLPQVMTFLDPRNWPNCSDLWCSMTVVGAVAGGPTRYVEVVSSACPNGAFTATTVLDFMTIPLSSGGGIASYHRTPDPEQRTLGGDGQVTVDEGSIEVQQVGANIVVSTTKRVQFSLDADTAMISMVACALGYSSVGEELVWNCAQLPGAANSVPFQGPTIPQVLRHRGAQQPSPGNTDNGSDVGSIVGEGVDTITACMVERAEACQAVTAKIQSGTYTTTDFFDYLSRSSAQALRSIATAMDLSIRAAQAFAGGASNRPAAQFPPRTPPKAATSPPNRASGSPASGPASKQPAPPSEP